MRKYWGGKGGDWEDFGQVLRRVWSGIGFKWL